MRKACDDEAQPSGTVAKPTTLAPSFKAFAPLLLKPFAPPSGASVPRSIIGAPGSARNARRTTEAKGPAEAVSALPATCPEALIEVPKLLSPPSVPRSSLAATIARFAAVRNARVIVSPAVFDEPTTWPALLMPFAFALLPPSVPRSVTTYL